MDTILLKCISLDNKRDLVRHRSVNIMYTILFNFELMRQIPVHVSLESQHSSDTSENFVLILKVCYVLYLGFATAFRFLVFSKSQCQSNSLGPPQRLHAEVIPVDSDHLDNQNPNLGNSSEHF